MRKTIISVFLFLVLGLSGCGHLETSDSSTLSQLESSITINNDGSVTNVIVEDFDKDYYSIDGLTKMVEDAIADFKYGEIKLDDITQIDSQVKVTMTYDCAGSFEIFNDKMLYFGLVQEAYDNGLLKNVTFHSTKDKVLLDGQITSENLEEYKDYHVIIMEENMNLYTFGEIIAIDDSGILNSKKSISFDDSSTNHIVIFK